MVGMSGRSDVIGEGGTQEPFSFSFLSWTHIELLHPRPQVPFLSGSKQQNMEALASKNDRAKSAFSLYKLIIEIFCFHHSKLVIYKMYLPFQGNVACLEY